MANWTEYASERDRGLKPEIERMLAARLTFAQIAVELDLPSRSAVAGVCRRLKLKAAPKPVSVHPEAVRKRDKRAEAKPFSRAEIQQRYRARQKAAKPVERPTVVGPLRDPIAPEFAVGSRLTAAQIAAIPGPRFKRDRLPSAYLVLRG